MAVLFIDTDIIIDFLIDRKPHSREAAIIFTLIEQKKIKGYVSSLTFSNLYYVLRKVESHNKVITKLDSISRLLTILKVDQQTINNAIASGFKDFEDSIQYNCALDYKKIDVLITRNTKDYKNSEIPVMTPVDYLKTVSS
ncbi:MAG: PIN domain-containing protein [Bacteroidales bacterium]|jgi:predicted nucleic acid-binding protein|nr:PIN domain-containing protein [Bacteroidales bacterium]